MGSLQTVVRCVAALAISVFVVGVVVIVIGVVVVGVVVIFIGVVFVVDGVVDCSPNFVKSSFILVFRCVARL